MSIIDSLLGELEQEAVGTRKMLERTPEEHFGWKPHPKSMSLAELASHLAGNPDWVVPLMKQDEMNLDPTTYQPRVAKTRGELLEIHDAALAKAKAAMRGASDEALMRPWRFRVMGEVKFEAPRVGVLRGMILNHAVHHRGQLSVYLRLKNVPLPALYGPSADEPNP